MNTISIIIPMYNGMAYIDDCVQKVLSQTFQDWELIIVDDGSDDGSERIVDAYAEQYENIRVIHQENAGLFVARTTGFLAANGEFCCTCDCDDYLFEDALTDMYHCAKETGCDYVVGKMTRLQNVNRSQDTGKVTVYEQAEIMQTVYRSCFGEITFQCSTCGKLYKTALLQAAIAEIPRHPFFFAEDLVTIMYFLPHIQKMAMLDTTVYYYCYNGGTSKFMRTFLEDNLIVYDLKKEMAERHRMTAYIKQLIDVEMKNTALYYLTMCHKTRTYPHGGFRQEVEFVLNHPQISTAVNAINEDVLQMDTTENGFIAAYKKKDAASIQRIVRKQAMIDKLKKSVRRVLRK